ncbi:hypothetical protein PENSOL_c039G09973 [Penicillium solitum]|uniref:ABC transporter domain-containing protein n=1 Tax=Penicillium solitum TaxID=60172 RepID=A0A1V6QTT0_9EURO|nr:uncharacterized protein PENSOL_c039G09973 [Penicillium solitum]OQD92614.1 hypothetical protein PENSOL_c039G09973 [Penicillium solitum]
MSFIQSLPTITQSIGCFDRIQNYCLRERSSEFPTTHTKSEFLIDGSVELAQVSGATKAPTTSVSCDQFVSFQNTSISWTAERSPIVHDLTLSIPTGKIIMVVGAVGCGKSALLRTIMGQTQIDRGTVYRASGKIAYCPQNPWIINSSIQDNITGWTPLDQKWYELTISACGLVDDISKFPRGNMHITGSSGIALSGGQKQRVALARAVYSRLPNVVLDDTFSGLDAQNTRIIGERLFGSDGIFRRTNTTVVLATHTRSLLPYADEVILLENGRKVIQGTYQELIDQLPEYTQSSLNDKDNAEVTEPNEITELNPLLSHESTERTESQSTELKKNMARRDGSWSIYSYYARKAGLLQVAFFVALLLAMLIVEIVGNTSLDLHSDLLHSVLRAPFSFFQKTDIGSIMNRFSQDMELIDFGLPINALNFVEALSLCIVSLVILCVLRIFRQVRLLDIEAKELLFSHSQETVNGLSGLKLALDVLVMLLVVILVAVVTALKDRFSAGEIGVALDLIISISQNLNTAIEAWTEMEISLGAVARVQEFMKETPAEASAGIEEGWLTRADIRFDNVSTGYRSDNCADHRPTLLNLSFHIPCGQKIAVCGPSGSGKTSLIMTILRMLEISQGRITIDNVDISTIHPAALRAQITVIPQDPFFLPGTLRYCFNPTDALSEQRIVAAIEKVGLWDSICRKGGLDATLNALDWSFDERQLLALARALTTPGPLLILDEATSGVDWETESRILEIIE